MNSLNQFTSRDRISSARTSGYRTDENVRNNGEYSRPTPLQRTSSVMSNNARGSIFYYSKIKKILERYVLKDCLSSFTNSHLGSVCFE